METKANSKIAPFVTAAATTTNIQVLSDPLSYPSVLSMFCTRNLKEQSVVFEGSLTEYNIENYSYSMSSLLDSEDLFCCDLTAKRIKIILDRPYFLHSLNINFNTFGSAVNK